MISDQIKSSTTFGIIECHGKWKIELDQNNYHVGDTVDLVDIGRATTITSITHGGRKTYLLLEPEHTDGLLDALLELCSWEASWKGTTDNKQKVLQSNNVKWLRIYLETVELDTDVLEAFITNAGVSEMYCYLDDHNEQANMKADPCECCLERRGAWWQVYHACSKRNNQEKETIPQQWLQQLMGHEPRRRFPWFWKR